MWQRLIVSSFVGLGSLFLVASAQQPAKPGSAETKAEAAPVPTPGQPGKGGGAAGGAQKADPTDALLHAALANDPDLKLAQAKLQLAEAEIAKARQAVILKVLTLNATIQGLKRQVDDLTLKAKMSEKAHASGQAALADLIEDRMKLEPAKSALAKAEMELKLITGGMQKEMGANTYPGWWNPNALTSSAGLQFSNWVDGYPLQLNQGGYSYLATEFNNFNPVTPATRGPIPDRVRAALDKSVKLGAKGEPITFAKALEVFKKDAGLDVPVREVAKVEPIKSEGEELPVGAWFQLFADNNPGVRFLVRDYGLLITVKDAAPADALLLIEFWKRPVKKDAETKPAAQVEKGR